MAEADRAGAYVIDAPATLTPAAALARLRMLVDVTPGRAVVAMVEAEPALWPALRDGLTFPDRPVELLGVTAETSDEAIHKLNRYRDLIVHDHALVGYLVADLAQLRRVVPLAPDLLSGLTVMFRVAEPIAAMPWPAVRAALRDLAERTTRAVPWPDGTGATTLPLPLLVGASGVFPLDGRGGWLIGGPGGGRTTALQARAADLLAEGRLTPVLVSLAAWQDTWTTRALPLRDWLPTWFAAQGHPGADVEPWPLTELALLLDDVDALEPAMRDQLAAELPSLDDAPEVWCAASPATWRRGAGRWGRAVDLPPADPALMVFSADAALDHVAPDLPADHPARDELRRALVRTPELRAIAATPLLLAAALATFARERRFPIDRRELAHLAAADPRFAHHALTTAHAAADQLIAHPPGAPHPNPPPLSRLEDGLAADVIRAWALNDQRAAIDASAAAVVAWSATADVRAALACILPLALDARQPDGRPIWKDPQRRAWLDALLRLAARALPDEATAVGAALQRLLREDAWLLEPDALAQVISAHLPDAMDKPLAGLLTGVLRAVQPAAAPPPADALQYAPNPPAKAP